MKVREEKRHTVPNYSSVNNKRQKRHLVRSSVVLECGRGVVITDRRVCRALCHSEASGSRYEGGFLEEHVDVCLVLSFERECVCG